MKYFLVIIIIFLYFSKVVVANMENPVNIVNDKNNILIDKQIIQKKIEAGEYDEARIHLKSFIETNSSDYEAYNLLGYVERQLQNYELAIHFYKKALYIIKM